MKGKGFCLLKYMKGWRKNDLKGLPRDFTAVYKVEKISLFLCFLHI